jgi:hypothetical protein
MWFYVDTCCGSSRLALVRTGFVRLCNAPVIAWRKRSVDLGHADCAYLACPHCTCSTQNEVGLLVANATWRVLLQQIPTMLLPYNRPEGVNGSPCRWLLNWKRPNIGI